jgi:hypothetical protein
MDDLGKVCAVIDMQGYTFNKKFYPRELCICNYDFEYCIEIDCSIECYDIARSKFMKHYAYQKYNIHGIPLDSIRKKLGMNVRRSEDIESIILKVYEKVKSEGRYMLACKNQQVSTLLTKMDIPHLDLDKIKIDNKFCPKLEEFDKTMGKGQVWFCPLHTCLRTDSELRKKMRCSLRKCYYIWSWICGKQIVNILLGSIDRLHLKERETEMVQCSSCRK